MVHSDEDGEDPYYPETGSHHRQTTRSGRKVYSVNRLVVTHPVDDASDAEPPQSENGTTDTESQRSQDSTSSNDSFVTLTDAATEPESERSQNPT